MNEIEVGGLGIAYRRAGTGPPLVLLHGGPLDSREWRRQLDGPADDFTVVAWEVRQGRRQAGATRVRDVGRRSRLARPRPF